MLRGWVRTGIRFLAYSAQVAGTNPVCRFYLRPEVGDSHFYSGDPNECAQTLARFGASWIYESPSVFYIALPNFATGACPVQARRRCGGSSTRVTTNHRYTTERLHPRNVARGSALGRRRLRPGRGDHVRGDDLGVEETAGACDRAPRRSKVALASSSPRRTPMSDITQLLRSANAGDTNASRELFSRMYADLKRLAHGNLHRNGGRAELNTTMLVHESYLRLAARGGVAPADRPAFFAYIGKVMRSVVLDTVRERRAEKRGGGVEPLQLTTGVASEVIDDEQLLAIDEALDSLERLAPELRRLVEMRYFAGLTIAEISEASGRSVRSVERDWEKARALLRKLMTNSDPMKTCPQAAP